MKTKRFKSKVSLITLVFTITLFVNIIKANAQGANAPEAASFEPVDATDLVDLFSGDLSYVLPIVNIPSPEGGYPLALSYHAGIALEQDASWVGLGWTLNPGALNRSVNFIPDDWENGQHRNIFYDAGGVTHSYSANLGVEISDDWSVGLFASYQENKSINGENSYSFAWGTSVGHEGMGFNISESGIGLTYDLQSNIKNENGEVTGSKYRSTIGVGFDYNTGVFASMSDKKSSVGITIGTQESFVSIGGGKLSFNSKGSVNSSKLSTRTLESHSLSISFLHFIRLGLNYSKTKYWFYDSTLSKFAGSLYPSDLEQRQYLEMYEDTSLLNDNESIMDNNIGFLSFDQYRVSAQGISGSISPNLNEFAAIKGKYKNLLYDGSIPDKAISYFTSEASQFSKSIKNNGNSKINFYFDNVYASHYRTIPSDWNNLSQASDINDVISNVSTSISVDVLSNFNANNSRYSKGPFVDYFLNSEINNNPIQVKQRGFMEAKEYDRTLVDDKFNNTQDGIGAFKITSSDGKTYHYSLPVYQKESYQFSTEKDKDINTRFLGNQKFKPYATHWLLTAITGPDYIDTNNNGEFDNKDYGYWVEFEYGRWLDNFVWGSPKVYGQYNYYDNNKSHSFGIKEVYYLDRVKTRTHSALFIKKERNDARGTEIDYGQNKIYSMDTFISSLFGNILNSDYYTSLMQEYNVDYSFIGSGSSEFRSEFHDFIDVSSNQKLLALDKIILIKNDDLDDLNYSKDSNQLNQNPEQCKLEYKHFVKILISNNIEGPYALDSYKREWLDKANYDKSLTNDDLDANFPNIYSKSLKTIEFNHDYKLAKNSPNQYESNTGRLTLNSLKFKGRNNVQHLPPYKFKYNDVFKNYDKVKEDSWGYYGADPDVWSLNEVTTPLGSSLSFLYESDDYHQVAVPSYRVFTNKLKFIFSNVNNKLRINVSNVDGENEDNINFSEFYDINKQAKINIWAAIKHEYHVLLQGCKSRNGHIDINDEYVDVVSLSNTEVTFETTLSNHTYNDNDGLGWLLDGRVYSYEMNLFQNKGRGEYPVITGYCSSRTRHTLYYSINSNKSLKDQKAGGTRVNKIALIMDGQEVSSTNYYYNVFGYNQNSIDSNYRSSGITSYTPTKFNAEIKFHTELPPPFVTYKNVTVEKKGRNSASIGKEYYSFETIEPFVETSNTFSLGNLLKISTIQKTDDLSITLDDGQAFYSPYRYEINNKLSKVGRLLSKYSYNTENQLISKTINKYKELTKESQGVHQESFSYYKQAFSYGETTKYKINATSKIIYPSVMESSYVIQDGYTSISYFDKYDFNTGQVLETRTYASDGVAFKTQAIPAYQKYPEMGSKIDNLSYSNMLTQNAMSKTFIKQGNDWKEISANITTWNNNWKYWDFQGVEQTTLPDKGPDIWRKHKSYVWRGDINSDGIYTSFTGDEDNFKWGVGQAQTDTDWQQISEVTKYDHYSMTLESKDINDNYASTKMGDNNSKVIAVANAPYTEVFYAGIEFEKIKKEDGQPSSYVDGEVKIAGTITPSGTTTNSLKAHTGNNYLKVNQGQNAFEVTIPARAERNTVKKNRFKISVWVRKGQKANVGIKVNGGSPQNFNTNETVIAGDWALLNGYVTITSSANTIAITSTNGIIDLDDFRLHPVTSTMTSYVYNEFDEVTFITGANGLSTQYKYDKAGRLEETWVEVLDNPSANVEGGFKQVSKNTYNYKKQ